MGKKIKGDEIKGEKLSRDANSSNASSMAKEQDAKQGRRCANFFSLIRDNNSNVQKRIKECIRPAFDASKTKDNDFEHKKSEAEALRNMVCGISGILAPIIGLSAVVSAARSTPDFSWRNEALSYMTTSQTRNTFMFGLDTAAILNTIFAYDLYTSSDSTNAEKFSAIGIGLANLGLALAASTKRNTLSHNIPAACYIALSPAILLSLGIDWMSNPSKRPAGIATAVTGALASAAIISGINKKTLNNAVSEIAESALLGAWTIGAGLWIANKRTNQSRN